MSTRTLYAACTCADWSHAWPQRKAWWPHLATAKREGESLPDAHYLTQRTTVEIVTEDEP